MTPRRRASVLLTANPWRVAALGLLAVLVVGAVIASGEESRSDERPGREELAVSFEGTLSGKLDQVKQDLRPALAEQGAAGSGYRVKEGSTRCREGDEAAPFRCVALLTDEQGFAFSLAYSVVSVEGGCWQAQPERVELANGRLVNTGGGNGGEARPLDGCVSSDGMGEDSLPPPPSEAPDQAVDDSGVKRRCRRPLIFPSRSWSRSWSCRQPLTLRAPRRTTSTRKTCTSARAVAPRLQKGVGGSPTPAFNSRGWGERRARSLIRSFGSVRDHALRRP